MTTCRIIPCLDVSAGRVVKGVQFENLVDTGDPVELAARYYRDGADEITLLDVDASKLGRLSLIDVVSQVAGEVFVPLTVGGGIRSSEDVAKLLSAGADKVAVSSAALTDPNLYRTISDQFGSQVLVASLDVKKSSKVNSGYILTSHGGSRETDIDAISWISYALANGVGELLINSIDADGTRKGFNLELLSLVREISKVPIVASGGAGSVADFVSAAEVGSDAVLAASVFHSGSISINQVKEALFEKGFPVRELNR